VQEVDFRAQEQHGRVLSVLLGNFVKNAHARLVSQSLVHGRIVVMRFQHEVVRPSVLSSQRDANAVG